MVPKYHRWWSWNLVGFCMKIGQIRQWGNRNLVGENQGIRERIYACIWSVGKQEEKRGNFIVSPKTTQCQNSDLHNTM
jgi:hypothetical protein